MRLNKFTRNQMLSTVKEMKDKLENLCQREYILIEKCNTQIKTSQTILEALELEYVNCDKLIKSIEDKIRQDN